MTKKTIASFALLSSLVLGALGSVGVHAQAAPNAEQSAQAPRYVTLDNPQATATQEGEVEVLEFFAYSCVHCANAEPILAAWIETQPENVKLQRVPIAFNRGMTDLQRAYFTFESLDRMDLHQAFFDAIHKDQQRLFDEKAITQWAKDQGIDPKKFNATFHSFGVNTRVDQANQLAKTYHIESTPSMAVDGRYIVSPTYTYTLQGMVDQADELVKERLAATN